VLLASLLLKLGCVGLVRLVRFDLFFLVVVFGAGLVGRLCGCLCAVCQRDSKALVAYSSVSHMNFLLAALCCGGCGASGTWVIMVAHGLVSGGLFYVCGLRYYVFGTRKLYFGGRLVGVRCVVVPLLVFFNFGLPPSVVFFGEVLLIGGVVFSFLGCFFVVVCYVLLVSYFSVYFLRQFLLFSLRRLRVEVGSGVVLVGVCVLCFDCVVFRVFL